MTTSYTSALTKITSSETMTVSQLFALVGDMSAKVRDWQPNGTYLLWSGSMPDGTRAKEAANDVRTVLDNGLVFDIGDTDVGKLLDSTAFQKKMSQAVAFEMFAVNYHLTSSDQKAMIDRAVAIHLNGHTGDYVRLSTTALWDIASHSYVESAQGNFRIIAPTELDMNSVLIKSELPALLANPNVPLVDGVSRAELKAVLDSHGIGAVAELVRGRSLAQVVTSGLAQGNASGYLELDDEKMAAAAKDPAKAAVLEKYLKTLTPEQRALSSGGMGVLGDLQKVGSAKHLLKAMAPVAAIVGLAVASSEAQAANDAGDPEKARQIMAEWAVVTTGTLMAEAAAAAVAGMAVAAAVGAGIISAPFAAIIVLGAAIAGGIYGEDGAKEFFALLGDRDYNNRRDIIDKMVNFWNGASSTITAPLPADLNGAKYAVDASLTRGEMVAYARESIAWRYALRELNPFVIVDADYALHNKDRSLDMFDKTTNPGGLTEQYLADRAAMLAWMVKFQVNGVRDDDDGFREGPKPYNVEWDTNSIAGNWDFIDRTVTIPGLGELKLVIDGTGISPYDHQVIFGRKLDDAIAGSGDADKLYGMSGNDALDGKQGDDYLEGGVGDDTLTGGDGNDFMLGGEGLDQYLLEGDFGKDLISDADSFGTIKLNSAVLGFAQNIGSRDRWAIDLGGGKHLGVALYNDPRSSTGKRAIITQGANAANSIAIDNFDLTKAFGPDGYLGIRLENKIEVALKEGAGPSVWSDLGFEASSLNGAVVTIAEQTAKTFTVYLNQAARAGDTIKLTLPTFGDKFKVLVGTETLAANGAVIVLKEGQTEASFGLLETEKMNGDVQAMLRATYTAGDITVASNVVGLLIADTGEAVRTLIGDFRWPLRDGKYDYSVAWHDGDGNMVGGVAEPGFADVLWGENTADRIKGGAGNDALDGARGNDELDGGDGDDLISGSDGNDTLIGGSGDDFIDSSNYLHVPVRVKPDDSWTAPDGVQVVTHGATWGNYFTTLDGEPVLMWPNVINDPTATLDADFIDGGDGDDHIVASGAGDRILGGNGNDNIDGMGGGDVIDAGAGADYVHADGITKLNRGNYAAPASHGMDLVDGGAGNDTVEGGGANDVLYGGTDDDHLYGDDSGRIEAVGYLDLAFHGDDWLDGGEGNDMLEGGGRNDMLFAANGDDQLWGDVAASNMGTGSPSVWGTDMLDGGAGDDQLIGGGMADTLYGGDGDDLLWGDEDASGLAPEFNGVDYLDGGAGHDQLVGGGKDDILLGGAGDDRLFGDNPGDSISAPVEGADLLDGGLGDDSLAGGAGEDVLLGGDGDDLLDGGSGADYMAGGLGSDSYVIDHENDIVVEIEETPAVLQKVGAAGAASLPAVAAASTDAAMPDMAALAAPTASGTVVNAVFASVSYTLGTGFTYLSLTGVKPVDGTGNARANALLGNEGANRLTGLDGNDALSGGKGNDTLDGGAGSDYMAGGAGDDVYLFGRNQGTDTISNTDFLRDSARPELAPASDTLRFAAGISPADVVAHRSGANLVMELAGGADRVTVLDYFGADIIEGTRVSDRMIERVEFSDGTIWNQAGIAAEVARAANNRPPETNRSLSPLYGHAGSSFSYVLPANTFVDPDPGDTVTYSITSENGAALPSWMQFDPATRTLSGTPGAMDQGAIGLNLWGKDRYRAGAGLYLTVIVEGLNSAPSVNVAVPDQAAGAGLNYDYTIPYYTFADQDDNDVLSWSATQSDGSALPRWLKFDSETHRLYGTPDPLDVSLTVRLSATDNSGLSAADTFAINIKSANLIGTAGDDSLAGTSADNLLEGLAGHDSIIAGNGDDTLMGGDGNDKLWAGQGNDVLNSGRGTDMLYGDAGNDTYVFDQDWGGDEVSDSGGVNVITFGAGIAPADIAVSVVGDNLILKRRGTSDLVAVVNAYDGNGRYSQVKFADATSWDVSAIKNATLIGTAASESLSGTSESEYLGGLGGNDSLSSGKGNDTLAGGVGDDSLYGALGNDRYLVTRGQGSDYLYENEGAGEDTLVLEGVTPGEVRLYRTSSASVYPNGINVDDLVIFTGSAGQQIRIGDFFDNTREKAVENFVFHDGTVWNKATILSHVIDQSGAISVMSGTSGDDLFLVDHPMDTINLGVAGGADRIVSSVNYWMRFPARMELTGEYHIEAHGSSGIDYIGGNAGNNFIDGDTALDTLAGGAGDDRYTVEGSVDFNRSGISVSDAEQDALLDIVIEHAGEGTDTIVTDAKNATLPANVENLVVEGTSAVYLIRNRAHYILRKINGNALDNVIDMSRASEGVARIDGGAGADTMHGGEENDIFVVDNAGDVVIETVGEVRPYGSAPFGDRIEASVSYVLPSRVEHMTLTGALPISGTGNADDNVLDGSVNTAINHLYGGLGNDTLIVDAGDQAHENAGEGIDTLCFGAATPTAYRLADYTNFENLALSDSAGAGSLLGDDADNVLTGNSGNNTLTGAMGNDTLVDNSNNGVRAAASPWAPETNIADHDVLVGGAGNDILVSHGGNDTLDGGSGDDQLRGGSGNTSFLFGANSGRDRILSDTGDLGAGAGAGDTIVVDAAVTASAIVLVRSGEALTVEVEGGGDSMTVEQFFVDTLSSTTRNTVERLVFSDASYWDNTALVTRLVKGNASSAGADVISGGVGVDVLAGLDGNDVLRGDAGNDSIAGDGGNDLLFGGSGADTLNGGAGDDLLVGGSGADSYLFERGAGADILEEGGATSTTELDSIVFGAGILPADVTVERGTGGSSTSLLLKIKGTADQLTLRDKLTGAEQTYANGVEKLVFVNGTIWSAADLLAQAQVHYGTEQGDYLNGDASNNLMYGYGGNDTLNGAEGADTLDGGAGVDQLLGGSGDDTYMLDDAGDTVQEYSGEGTDLVIAAVSYSLPADVENLALTGSALNGTGNAGVNSMTGNANNNVLNGGAGADTMAGGLGNDTYVVDNVADVVTEQPGEGLDTVQAAVSFTLPSQIENLTLTGSALNATGNALANILTGNGSANTLNGREGADSMVGGAGNDTYIVDQSDDAITETSSAGTDSVQSTSSYVLPLNVENLTLTGAADSDATGNAAVNSLTGNAGANRLDGGAGGDTMAGGNGDDIYVVDSTADIFKENLNEGSDTVLASVSVTLAANVEKMVLTGTASSGTGNSGNNVLIGNGNGNTLDGGLGNDTMTGGGGDDIYVLDNVNDQVVEVAGEGIDTVQTGFSYILGQHIENLVLNGASPVNGTGNTLNNSLSGNALANLLDGAIGADTMAGAAGNDTYVVDNAGDVISEAAAGGIDLVQSSITYTLGAEVENLTLTGSSDINATGNGLNNSLRGNLASNVLSGGLGVDTMAGGAADDIYVVDNSSDTIVELAGEGTDLVQASVSFTLSGNVENLTLTGSGVINGSGNGGDNLIIGNAGANALSGAGGHDTLNGGAGIDSLTGGLGNDTYVVENAADLVTEVAGEGTDVVQSSITLTLSSNIEALVLTGTGMINGSGNTGHNLLLGNGSANILNGAAGNDILQGGAGADTLSDTTGNNLFDGGAGDDVLGGGTGNELFIGGAGNDKITTSTGSDIIAFNRGDGMDTLMASTGKDNTISLGKGILYADLLFKKNLNDLVLVTGSGEQVTLKDWYVGTANRSVANLQVVIEGTSDYNSVSASAINNRKVERFNFDGLATAFDQARAANPAITSWALSTSLTSFHLSGSDSAAMGGDLAYRYARDGNFAGVSLNPASASLASTQFGTAAQVLQTSSALQDASIRLM